jgi:hypothetical protein
MPDFNGRVDDLNLAIAEVARLMDIRYGEKQREFYRHLEGCESCRESLVLQASNKYRELGGNSCEESILMQKDISGMYDRMVEIKNRFHGIKNSLKLFGEINFPE